MNNKLTPEQTEKLDACKTADEVNELAEKENNGLTDEQLEEIAGGIVSNTALIACKKCGKWFNSSVYTLHLRTCNQSAPITRE